MSFGFRNINEYNSNEYDSSDEFFGQSSKKSCRKQSRCRRVQCRPPSPPNPCPPNPCPPIPPTPPIVPRIRVQNLVSNLLGASTTDPNLINAWGNVVIDSTIYVADNGTGKITTYTRNGVVLPLVITVNGPTGASGSPTGLVHNTTNEFSIRSGQLLFPTLLLTATENGTINAYSPQLNLTSTTIVVDQSVLGTVYKGLALSENYLYAADFHNNRIDVFDQNFNLVSNIPGAFSFTDPSLPSGFAPFNIYYSNDLVYVLYARQLPPENHDDLAGPGNGYINVFTPTGILVRRLVSNGPLNSPWGIIAVGSLRFGQLFIVGNFGDGYINIFDSNGLYLGRLKDCNNLDINISGLWGLSTNNRHRGTRLPTIYFTAGPNDETNGLLGSLNSNCQTILNNNYIV